MRVEEHGCPRGRRRVGERERREVHEEVPRAVGILGRLERDPVGFRLHPAAEHVEEGLRGHAERDEGEQRNRHRLRLSQRAATPSCERDQERPGHRKDRVPPNAFPDVLAGVVRDLVREHHSHLVVSEAPVEHRVPDEDLS